jgi:methyl-accepting chemotaxis protein
MAGILPVSFIFNETQNIPTHNLSYNVDIFNKLVEMSNKSLVNNNDEDINHIKTHLITLEMQYQNLFNLCQDINKSIIKVNDKLSQYDIDEITEVEEVVNEITEVEEVVNEITEIVTEVDEVVNEITKITEIVTEVDEVVNEITKITEIVTEVDEVVNEITEVDEVVNEITEVDEVVNEITEVNEVTEVVIEVIEDSKPKRKYNRRKK